jgi:hypothetical protein
MAEREYQRLTRTGARSGFAVAVTSRSSLWLGRDHLLLIDSNGYTETYKRFYFQDIQAFTISITNRSTIWNWVLGGFTGIWVAIVGLISSSDPNIGSPALISFVIVLAFFAVPLLINNLLGPTCGCRIRTAVQTEDLYPLKRLRLTRRVLAQLRPYITEAQTKPSINRGQTGSDSVNEAIPSSKEVSSGGTAIIDSPQESSMSRSASSPTAS